MLNSFFAQLLIQMQARITTQVPEIRYIDQDFHQVDIYEGDRPPVALPCVLIDFTDTTYEALSRQVQMGTVNIGVRLALETSSTSNNLAPVAVKETALRYFEIENKLYTALQNWLPESEICQPLNRLSAHTEKGREDALRVRSLVFTTSFEDNGASPVVTKTPATLQLQYD